uniref:C-type lectin domain-containing protein n=1 Tax=Oryzias sinensis TaxID=183150 RepID=A0A8C8DRF8_9TELE
FFLFLVQTSLSWNSTKKKVGCKSKSSFLFIYLFIFSGKVRIKVIQDNSTWDEALTYCEMMHSRLLWIEDESDQNAVSMWLNHSSFDRSTPRSFWIGLRQSVLFGFWIWSDRMVNWSNWKDEKIPEKSPFNHCGVIDRKDYTWRNEDCDQKLVPSVRNCPVLSVLIHFNIL